MRYWKTCYITCFIFVLIPLTLYGQEDVEQLQKLDKLMFSGRFVSYTHLTMPSNSSAASDVYKRQLI